MFKKEGKKKYQATKITINKLENNITNEYFFIK